MLEGSSGCAEYVERPEEPWPGTGREPISEYGSVAGTAWPRWADRVPKIPTM